MVSNQNLNDPIDRKGIELEHDQYGLCFCGLFDTKG